MGNKEYGCYVDQEIAPPLAHRRVRQERRCASQYQAYSPDAHGPGHEEKDRRYRLETAKQSEIDRVWPARLPRSCGSPDSQDQAEREVEENKG